MRLDIICADRIGITQEILTVFSQLQLNIRAMEVVSEHIYVHFLETAAVVNQVQARLLAVPGVSRCREINWLPSEQKAKHLDTLLANIPSPIFDVDRQGQILVANKSAISLSGLSLSLLKTKSITSLLDLEQALLGNTQVQTVEVLFAGHSYFAEITPIVNQKEHTGAVVVLHSMNRIGRQLAATQRGQDNVDADIIGQSRAIKDLVSNARKFAKLDLPVLISGETGTGKELTARLLHNASARANHPFLAINCAALPEQLLESELFGYAPGAFSGAQRSGKPGLFELGDGGTIFLDEIGEMSVYLQAKLLRFLQEYRFRRVGGTREIEVNVRVISATHRNLPVLVTQELFRQDLFYRLNALQLQVPALRERKDDIELLANYFIERAAQQLARPVPLLSDKAWQQLINYRWPGNIRQLQNVLFRAVALAEGDELSHELLTFEQQETSENVQTVGDWKSEQAKFERELLTALWPLYPSTRRLAERLNVSHNKIAMKLRQHALL